MNETTAANQTDRTNKRTKASRSKKGAGRPKGASNRDYVDVVVIPPKCPSCGVAIDVKRGKKYREAEYGHVHDDGTRTNVVRWYRTTCACGQAISYRRHEYDESKENIPAKNI